jgi:hypothetical protein
MKSPRFVPEKDWPATRDKLAAHHGVDPVDLRAAEDIGEKLVNAVQPYVERAYALLPPRVAPLCLIPLLDSVASTYCQAALAPLDDAAREAALRQLVKVLADRIRAGCDLTLADLRKQERAGG